MNNLKGYFAKESEFNSFVLLKIIKMAEGPVGSWILRERMIDYQIDISLATIGRLLKELDQKKHTKLIQSQGREITSEGIKYLERVEEGVTKYELQFEVMQASTPTNHREIIDLLRARKLIETATIRQVVQNATEKDIELIEQSISSHIDCVEHGKEPGIAAINFHALLADLSCNRFLSSALKLLIQEEVEMERKFPEIAEKLRAAHHIVDHQLIVNAIKQRDVEKAAHYMCEHLDKLISSI